ncbi:bifunctional phosphopantothenoylcysteine decarboxylase/phosphopantothenate--cysteine ligase CoaBC [Candidatus Berkiella cookevillensis]|uniref:Coenzyme A biosynthesis bifunctional protein CoaBC n=1 Tax=Candidatus Berkiella cookevillensis TaxID=437022 RepID=A0A0Q9YFZ3_9GAMM|nr:bifunctional phosphopantothenoylcysteine decarboxylase/phosphopantothenate--cysteine ligase CoaBC [Candidatus Berkiella cookevillensis]MCS5707442.1 bifunctional phosphopantothenoylcysteine decarboxylase/phosphopantothenate--cysteine ligase CoaBC [Candidatus Berkiella cookevillensis]
MSFSQNWLLGVAGGIAAYKAPEIVRLLKQKGADVRVVLSGNASEFVTKMTLQALSGHPVHDELFDSVFEAAMGHIELAKWADQILIAPLSANRLAALAHGFADDLLSTLCLASNAPVWVAPAMNKQMWSHTATQENLAILQRRGVHCVGPDFGIQACGDIGWGRMLEPGDILEQIQVKMNAHKEDKDILAGLSLLITAGPTREYLDPVRFISNKSSGKMGYALASAARDMGANVTLISGPVSLVVPEGITVISVESAQQMYKAVMDASRGVDIVIGCAAVADFGFQEQFKQKIKKHPDHDEYPVVLLKNPDIMSAVAHQENRPFCVGFAAETENFRHNAKEKLQRKKLDMIALNDISQSAIGFDADDNQLTVFSATEEYVIPRASKYEVARLLLKKIREVACKK